MKTDPMPTPTIPALPTLIRAPILDPDPPSGRSDFQLITSSWLNDYWAKSRDNWARQQRKRVFMAEHRQIVLRLLQRCHVLVACNLENPEQVYGWVCYVLGPHIKEPLEPTLHYVYVKLLFRNSGVASKLLERALGDRKAIFTHRTEAADSYLRQYLEDYNLYRAIGG